MTRPLDRHIDNDELDALVPSSPDDRQAPILFVQELREAEAHVLTCSACARKVASYRMLLHGRSRHENSPASQDENRCQKNVGLDWNDVVAGHWPEFKARQLIMHAAMCDDCGAQLRNAIALKNSSAADISPQAARSSTLPKASRVGWRIPKLLVPIFAVLLVLSLVSVRLISNRGVSGEKFAVLAAEAHQHHAGNNLDLEIRSDSTSALNAWFQSKLQFPLTLPVAPTAGPYVEVAHFEGARRVEIGGKPAAYVAYRTDSGPASLIVTSASVVAASGGSVADYKKVSFHYAMVEGYKVVTWSQHGLTYALVSQEGNDTQQSCMVCHSAMRDRDLRNTPTPLRSSKKSSFDSVLEKL